MEKTYYVVGNLRHDGTKYYPGDTIELHPAIAKKIGTAVTSRAPAPPPPNKDRIQSPEEKAKLRAEKDRKEVAEPEQQSQQPAQAEEPPAPTGEAPAADSAEGTDVAESPDNL